MRCSNTHPSVRCKAFIFTLAGVLALTSVCFAVAPSAAGPRPAAWAKQVKPSLPGLPNLYRVNASLYRSAQPTDKGFAYLATQPKLANGDRPIKTVLSLRASEEDVPLVPPGSKLRIEQIRFNTWHPEDEDVIKFLRILTTPELQPVLVHCQHGSDRTGMMVAIYRIAYDHWSKAQAIDEMVNGGYGFHPMWANLRHYIEKLDVDAIKKQVEEQGALKEPPIPPSGKESPQPGPAGQAAPADRMR